MLMKSNLIMLVILLKQKSTEPLLEKRETNLVHITAVKIHCSGDKSVILDVSPFFHSHIYPPPSSVDSTSKFILSPFLLTATLSMVMVNFMCQLG